MAYRKGARVGRPRAARTDDAIRRGPQWKRMVAAVRAKTRMCYWCREVLIYGQAPAHPDPRSFSVEHIVPISKGGNPYLLSNCVGAHLGCNSSRRDRETPRAGYVPGVSTTDPVSYRARNSETGGGEKLW